MSGDTEIEKSNASANEIDTSDGSRMLAAASYALIIILIGVPLWWKTTEVYRVSLPYDHLSSLGESRVNLTVPVTIVIFDERVSAAELSSVKSRFQTLSAFPGDESISLQVNFNFLFRHSSEKEKKDFEESKSLFDLEDKLNASIGFCKMGAISVAVLPSENHVLTDVDFHAGRHCILFTTVHKDLRHTFEKVSDVIHELVKPSALHDMYDYILKKKRDMPDRASMRTLRTSFEVDITFTLVLPETRLVNIDWDIRKGIHDYLQPFIDKMKNVVKLNVKSQIFYLTYLDIRAHFNAERRHYVLTSDRLAHIVNPIEAKMGSYVSMNPALNFVVYIPMEAQSPLRVYAEDGQPSIYNAFLIPRWGGFHVHNVDAKDVANGNATVDMQYVMGVFLAQMKILLGVSNRMIDSSIRLAGYDKTCLHDWELDKLMRMRTVENFANSASTLKSLAQLLDQISNIVISDYIGEQIYHSIDALIACSNAMQKGDIEIAFALSKEAFRASETAFFDPSMLSLLYFPEDQKYAVYMPLFLPVCLPLFLSLVPLAKWLRKSINLQRSPQKQEKTD